MNSSFECIPIDPLSYDLAGFSCRDEAMGAWLDRRAWDYHTKNFSRVWILTPTEGDKGVVAGYFTLSSTMLQKTQLSRKQRSAEGGNLQPHRIPATLIGKFAVARDFQGQQLPEIMMLEAYKRFLESSNLSASQFLVVELRNDPQSLPYLTKFYKERFGFEVLSGDNSHTQFTVMARSRRAIAADIVEATEL